MEFFIIQNIGLGSFKKDFRNYFSDLLDIWLI